MVMVVGSWLFWDGGSAGLGWWVGPAIPIPGQVSFSYSSVDAAAAAGGLQVARFGCGWLFFFFFFFHFFLSRLHAIGYIGQDFQHPAL